MEMKDILLDAGYPYQEILSRFSGNEALLKKFLLKFPNDPTFADLQKQVKSEDFVSVEKSAHTLKGVSANLGFQKLSAVCADIVAAVRSAETREIPGLFELALKEYRAAVNCIEKIS